jgi:putative membrane protein
MQWWCSATGQPWTWAWQAYPGVWLFVGLLAAWYWRMTARPGSRAVRPSERLWFLTGLGAVWIALDWPLGALGAGYLASVHAVSYILLSVVAPPCFLLGIPMEVQRHAATSTRWGPPLVRAGRPWFGLAVFAVVQLATHVPEIVDAAMATQVGALLIDVAWLGAGFALWWPVMGPSPEVVRISRPLKMGYLFFSTLPTIIPSAFLTFARFPLYATYELAPRIFPVLTALEDQRVAGLLMKIVGDLPVWFAFGVIFFRWAKEAPARPHPVHPGN